LRGNSGVQILINGKPSILADPEGNALGSITADMIERIEVITNPSAKYEAEGTAGIINIVLKKEEKKGLNGSISANTGIPANHSLGGSMNYRTDNFNFFTQFGAGYRSLPRFRESENRDLTTGTAIITDGTEYRNEAFYNITLGADYYLTEKDVITLSGSFAFEDEEQPSETEFSSIGENGVIDARWLREESTQAENPKYQFDLQYQREFESHEDHKLLFTAQGNFFGKEQRSQFTNTSLLNSEVDPDQRTATDFFERRYILKLDYTNPFSDHLTLEAGGLYEIKDVGNEFEVFNEIDDVYVPDSNFINDFEYDQDVLGIYTTLAYEKERWGVKLGLRAEHTYLRTELVTTGEENNQDFTNLFPTVHTSYEFNDSFSLQAGYSRRIYRPRLWDLNPFFNIRNNYNIRQGNPELLPEFSDSYEITAILIKGQVSLNSSLYYLYTTEVIERVTFSEDNVNITKPINLGTNDKIGFELNGKYNPAKWLTFNWDFNWGYFRRDGSFEDTNFDYEDDQWSGELTTKIKMPSDLEIEVAANYQSGFETVQGNVSGFAFANAGIRKKFLKGKIVVNLGIRDIFNSRIRESFARQPDFFFYDFSWRGTFYTLGVSYGFGKGEAMTYSGRRR
jgi:outer membrane receptor protein involved in Fe transport